MGSKQKATPEHVAHSNFPTIEYYTSASSVASTTASSGMSAPGSYEDIDDQSCTDSLLSTSPTAMVAPKNFGQVIPGVYRCAYPKTENLAYLRSLGLKSILTLVPEHYSGPLLQFVTDAAIQHFQVGIEPNKDPFVTIPQCHMTAALGVVMNRDNYPLLIHCNKGKHRTGCVVGCFRKILGLELADIFQEYHNYADPKARVLDERFIELFDERSLLWLARNSNLLPSCEPINDSPISASTVSTRLRS